jgi:uncharacterized protein (TIGR03083 family)
VIGSVREAPHVGTDTASRPRDESGLLPISRLTNYNRWNVAGNGSMKPPPKIVVVDRFAPLRTQLIELLARLSDDDWARPTAAPLWSVKDVTAHLLGGDVGVLSRERDGRPATPTPGTYADLVNLVNRLNEEWVVSARRMSPRLLRDLLDFTGPAVEEYFLSLDLDAIGGPISWAGTDPAPVWFDIAREFTERWHHQQQIRDATGQPPLYDPYFLSPVLDTFVRALPHSFRDAAAPVGTAVRLEITGDAGGNWFLIRTARMWELTLESETGPAMEVILPQDTAWRMFTKGIDPETAQASALVRGDASLAPPIFRTISVIG